MNTDFNKITQLKSENANFLFFKQKKPKGTELKFHLSFSFI